MSTKKIIVKISEKKQEILIGRNLIYQIGRFVNRNKYDNVLMLVDSNVYEKFKDEVNSIQNSTFSVIERISPDTRKDYNQVRKIISKIANHRLSRKSCLLVVGGGHVGDLSGFIASIYMRGIDMVYVPTTFMSQADTIIGKVAINFGNKKNLLGSFYSPVCTLCDLNLLRHLSAGQIASGLVEVWKHGILTGDKKLINEVRKVLLGKKRVREALIFESIKIKKKLVEIDCNDIKGNHKALSLGHTMANYLEKDKAIKHGEAVLYGIFFSALISKGLKEINDQEFVRIFKMFNLFRSYVNNEVKILKLINARIMCEDLLCDKINIFGMYNFVIPTTAGWSIAHNVSREVIIKSIEDFNYCLKRVRPMV